MTGAPVRKWGVMGDGYTDFITHNGKPIDIPLTQQGAWAVRQWLDYGGVAELEAEVARLQAEVATMKSEINRLAWTNHHKPGSTIIGGKE